MSEWRRIDNLLAIDGGQVLAFGPCGVEMVTWDEYYKCWDDADGDDYYKDAKGYFTHWMPLPEPPHA
jgi:hypothetical protein